MSPREKEHAMPCYLEQRVSVELNMADVPLLISAGSSLGWEHTLKDDVLVFTTPQNQQVSISKGRATLDQRHEALILELKQAYAQTIIQTAAEQFGWTLERVEGAEQELLLTRFS